MHRINIVRTVPRWKSPFVPYVFFLFSSFWPPRAITRPINLISSPWEAPPRCQKSYFPASLSLSLSLCFSFSMFFFFSFFLSFFLSTPSRLVSFRLETHSMAHCIPERDSFSLFFFCFVLLLLFSMFLCSLRWRLFDFHAREYMTNFRVTWTDKGCPRDEEVRDVFERNCSEPIWLLGEGGSCFRSRSVLRCCRRSIFLFFLIFKIYIFHD